MTDDDLSGLSSSDATPLPPFFSGGSADGGARPRGEAPAAPFFPKPTSAPTGGGSAASAPPPITAQREEGEPVEPARGEEEDLPDDIFFVPEGAAPPVAAKAREGEGLHAVSAKRAADEAAVRLAARLDKLADKLRADGSQALHAQMSSTDRLDALLAAVLAGYLARDA